ncbi:MAG: peptide deformylase [Clostridia bacterium]|jgi:peptide deformylase|nr:peptide deformylase [Clostridia bacterium]
MAKRNIRIYPDEALRKKCRPVKDITKSVVTLIDDMAETMYGANGAGLAAPQVGVLKRIVVIDAGEGLVELINPVFLEKSGSQIGDEGCLSLPGKWATVERPDYAKVKALNKKGETIIVEGHDLMARALCHEIDHLDGVLYIDKAIEPPEKENEN